MILDGRKEATQIKYNNESRKKNKADRKEKKNVKNVKKNLTKN